MESTPGSQLKSDWMEMPDDCFEPLTFGELEIGQKFIGLPAPGDNHGHGGFRGSAHVFVKTITEAGSPGMPYGIPHGGAVNISRGTDSNFPNSMRVIRVE